MRKGKSFKELRKETQDREKLRKATQNTAIQVFTLNVLLDFVEFVNGHSETGKIVDMEWVDAYMDHRGGGDN